MSESTTGSKFVDVKCSAFAGIKLGIITQHRDNTLVDSQLILFQVTL